MLRLDNICKRFGDLIAVDHLSLDLAAGEIFGLLGPNGAGKTTTVKIAVGLLAPDEGTATLGEAGPPSDPKVRANIGVAPQALALYDELTGRENLAFFGRLYGLTGKVLRDRVDQALAFAGLTDRQTDRVANYSGGMQRRLNLAVAVLHEPPLLLLDEPTVGVDPQSRNAIFESIQAFRQQGRTVVYTTHYMEEAQRLCDRVGIIDHGKLLALGTVDELLAQHGGTSVVVVERANGQERIETDNPAAELARQQQQGGFTGFRVEQPNLESIFLKLTGRHLRD